MILGHFSALLALGTLCRAWRADFSDAAQCGTVTVTWSATALESIGPPFVLRVAAFGLAPLIFNLSDSAWSALTRTGSYSFTVPWPEGTRFLSVMDDGFGMGTGGVSGIQTVKSSSNSSCINSSITNPNRVFDIYSSFAQCSTVSMNWTEPATSQTRIAGLVPNGVAFQLDPPLSGSKSTTWDLNIEAGTAFILIYGDALGNGLTSPLLQSLESSTTRCLVSGAYPSVTASQTGVAEATATGTSTPPIPSATSSPSSNKRSNLGAILGAVCGTLALLGALAFGAWIMRRRRKRMGPQTPELAKGADLDTDNIRLDRRFSRNYPSPYHPEGAVILPFVLPPDGSSQENTASNPQRKRLIHEASRDTVEASNSSQFYRTSTSASQSTPGFHGDPDDTPMIIRHEDAGVIIPTQTREVIELPPGYDQLAPAPAPPAPLPQVPQEANPQSSQKYTVGSRSE